jgi:hypothetical protein
MIQQAKLPRTAWFWVAYLMATHSNRIAALQLQRQLGSCSYNVTWLLCARLRSSKDDSVTRSGGRS